MQFDLMKKTVIGSVAFAAAAMGMILYMSAGKVITISDVAQDEVRRDVQEEASSEQGLIFTSDEGGDGDYLCIPLPKECRAEDIIVENHYMDQELCILISEVESAFYEVNAIAGDCEMIKQGVCEEIEGGIQLRFMLTGIFEYRTILENNDLYVSFLSPRELYDKIVVIDPACGGVDSGYVKDGLFEKEINLKIAQKLKEKLDETDIKAYYTRMDDANPVQEERVKLTNETRADMYICIQVDAAGDSRVYGTTAVYNGDYFIPGFGNVELADLLEREVVTSIRGKALGLKEAGAWEYALKNITIPGVSIKTGYITNPQEAVLLGRDEYQEKIASGIFNAIMKAYEETD